MGIVRLEQIDLKKLDKIKSNYHLESDLYHNNKIVYKIYKSLTDRKATIKQRKINLLQEGAPLPITVMPIDELYYKRNFFGYTMEYINKSKPLFDINVKDKNQALIMGILSQISTSLEQIHKDPRNIIISDLNFDNIIIDKQNNPHIIDIDSCSIDGIPGDTIPNILHNFYEDKKRRIIIPSQNTDKLSLLLSTLYIIFQEEILYVPMYEYDKKTERINILKDIRGLVLELKKSKLIPEIPYIHEIISVNDALTKSKKCN